MATAIKYGLVAALVAVVVTAVNHLKDEPAPVPVAIQNMPVADAEESKFYSQLSIPCGRKVLSASFDSGTLTILTRQAKPDESFDSVEAGEVHIYASPKRRRFVIIEERICSVTGVPQKRPPAS
jgi:hypothetical protein